MYFKMSSLTLWIKSLQTRRVPESSNYTFIIEKIIKDICKDLVLNVFIIILFIKENIDNL